ncbi:50S ribosomal protein L9 [Geochorda subterranea]|uniref:Large ribosomal subunit protein bL9 n=1 Tax=Geochorda subterranea TaxID=3109564 RepID=A0ABZ1BPP4_9FIRM|nr:50S ribosomal protein L9 [Limnochorda sp. LNt]WRP14684.1 50S ribosomal protein L9 [Limnochorda sp. LNt]
MKVVLTQDVKGVGRAGELVEVADGFGRNYLVPRGLAVMATGGTVKAVEHQQAVIRRKLEKERAEAESLAAKLQGARVVVKARAGDAGRLFGSVTAADVAEALERDLGVKVDRRRIELEGPIKSLGEHAVSLRLAPGISAEVRVVVEAADGEGPSA